MTKIRTEIEAEFETKFIIPNGHFHDFYYKENPYKRTLWSNYISEPGVDELKNHIISIPLSILTELCEQVEGINDYKPYPHSDRGRVMIYKDEVLTLLKESMDKLQ